MARSTDFITTYGDTFLSTYERVEREITEREDQKIRTGQRKDYNLLAANLANFMPHIPASAYESIYRRSLINHRLSANSFKYVDFGSLNHLSISGHTEFLDSQTKRKPHIFCTFHLGGYRAVFALLINAGYPLALVTDNRTYVQQKDEIKNMVSELNAYKGTSVSVQMLDAESLDIGKRMAMALASGHSILILPDGNTGVGGSFHRSAKQLQVPFLNQVIYSRTGIATLSQAMKVPITSIISRYDNADGIPLPHFYCAESIDPKSLNLPQEEYVRYATTTLYKMLSDELVDHFDQWESWFYIHKFLDMASLSAPAPLQESADPRASYLFDSDRYGVFKLEHEGYLFDKRTYRAYGISPSVYAWLSTCSATSLAPEFTYAECIAQQPAEVIDQLYQKRVLIVSGSSVN